MSRSLAPPHLTALAATSGWLYGRDGSAALLAVNPSTLWSRMKKLGITKQSA